MLYVGARYIEPFMQDGSLQKFLFLHVLIFVFEIGMFSVDGIWVIHAKVAKYFKAEN